MSTRATPSLRRAALAALLSATALLPGCLLVDAREELTIEPPGTLYGAEVVRLRVNGPCDTVTLELDGEPVEGSFPANEEIVVPLALPEGSHLLVARAREGALAGATVERALQVDMTPFELLAVDPAPGTTIADPFAATFVLSRPIDPLVPPEAWIVADLGTSRSVSLVISQDLRSVTLTLDGALDEGKNSSLVLVVAPAGAAQRVGLRGGPWRPPSFTVEVTSPPPDVSSTAPFRFTGTAAGDLPAAAELWAGEHLVAPIGPPPWDLDFDAASLPDGRHQLSVRAHGYYVHGTFPYIWVDSAVPRVIRCAPAENPPDQASANECVEVEFSEPVVGAAYDARLVVDGAPRATDVTFDGDTLRLCPADALAPAQLPAIQVVSLPALSDPSGNPVAPLDCEMTLSAWRAVHGATLSGVSATDVALPVEECVGGHPAALLAIAPAGEPGGGTVRSWAPPAAATGPWVVERELRGVDGSVAADLGPMAWIERVGTGPGLARTCAAPSAASLNADTGRDARRPSGVSTYHQRIAWSEEDSAGGRRIRAVNAFPRGSGWVSVGSPPRLAPGSVADAPAAGGAMIAWTESSGGAVSQLRVARPRSPEWAVVPGVGNLDPSVAAADPVVVSDDYFWWHFVAWREGGSVLATVLHEVSLEDLPLGAPQVLNVDPSRAARLPRFDHGLFREYVLYWVGESLAGDVIWGRRWTGAAWELLPGPVNAGAEGRTVRSLDARGWTVVWADDAGTVRMRTRGW